MQKHFELVEHKGAGLQARFYVNGIRASREEYEHIEQMGYSHGRISTFHTKGKPMPGGKIRRTNYKTVQY